MAEKLHSYDEPDCQGTSHMSEASDRVCHAHYVEEIIKKKARSCRDHGAAVEEVERNAGS